MCQEVYQRIAEIYKKKNRKIMSSFWTSSTKSLLNKTFKRLNQKNKTLTLLNIFQQIN